MIGEREDSGVINRTDGELTVEFTWETDGDVFYFTDVVLTYFDHRTDVRRVDLESPVTGWPRFDTDHEMKVYIDQFADTMSESSADIRDEAMGMVIAAEETAEALIAERIEMIIETVSMMK